MWPANQKSEHERFAKTLASLKDSKLKVARAWATKKPFCLFWNYCRKGCTKYYFVGGYSWAICAQLDPVSEKAKMIRLIGTLVTYGPITITL